MNKRQAKKKDRESFHHGYYPWVKRISREANELEKNHFLRNNRRKMCGEPMFRLKALHRIKKRKEYEV